MLTWLANPLFTLMLRLNRFGRLVLNDEEKRQSSLVAGGIVAGLIGVVVWATPTLNSTIGFLWALACMMMLIPLSAIFRCEAGWRRWLMACYTAGMATAAVAMVVCFIVALQQRQDADVLEWLNYVRELFRVLIYAGIGGGLLANILITIRR